MKIIVREVLKYFLFLANNSVLVIKLRIQMKFKNFIMINIIVNFRSLKCVTSTEEEQMKSSDFLEQNHHFTIKHQEKLILYLKISQNFLQIIMDKYLHIMIMMLNLQNYEVTQKNTYKNMKNHVEKKMMIKKIIQKALMMVLQVKI